MCEVPVIVKGEVSRSTSAIRGHVVISVDKQSTLNELAKHLKSNLGDDVYIDYNPLSNQIEADRYSSKWYQELESLTCKLRMTHDQSVTFDVLDRRGDVNYTAMMYADMVIVAVRSESGGIFCKVRKSRWSQHGAEFIVGRELVEEESIRLLEV